MKKTITATVLATAMLLFTSCDEKAKLADAVTGSWSGQAERIDTPNQPTTTTVTRMFTFTPDLNNATGGVVNATAMFSVQSGTQLSPAGIQPIAVTVDGNATITGRWQAMDDDEIIVSFDSKSLAISVDPEEVLLEYDIATETTQTVSDSIKPQIAASVTRAMKQVMHHSVFNFTKIDDIKIKDNLMSCEIGKTDYTFHRDM